MAAIIECFLLSDDKRAAFAGRRARCVQQSRTFKDRVEAVIKTRLRTEAAKITVEQELAQQAEQFTQELTASICSELDAIRTRVVNGNVPVAEGLAAYRDRTSVEDWPTVVIEAKPGESVDALGERVEQLGYVLCDNDYAPEESKALKFACLGMLHAHVPPESELLKPLSCVEGVAAVFDAERVVELPQPQPTSLEHRESSTDTGSILLDPNALPDECPRDLGKGATICVIDSGIDKAHPDLAGRVVAERDFTGEAAPGDCLGHGTHCAGVAAGTGAASAGRFAGVAPHAALLNARVFDREGKSVASQVLAAIRWAVDNRADVISLTVCQRAGVADGDSLLSRACDKAAQAGVVVCVAAGNDGPGRGTIVPPGDAAMAISVAAIDRARSIAEFSSRGPTAAAERTGPKPDVVAPGVDIVSCLSSGSDWPAAPGQPRYAMGSGTSVAAAHVAGAAAVLVSYLKALGRTENVARLVKDALVSTSERLAGAPEEAQGMGLIRVPEAAAWAGAQAGSGRAAASRVQITLGRSADGPVVLSGSTFQRHFACLGSSGSGKTVACKVICEEFIRQGVPVIAIDPQGDIARMGERAGPDTVRRKGVPLEVLEQYDRNADVVIWTPASSKGIPLCVNPLNFDFESQDEEVVVHSLSTMADSICSLVGYDLDRDEGASAQSFLYMVFEHIFRSARPVDSFTGLSDAIGDLPEPVMKRAASIITSKEIRTLTRKLLNLTIGVKGLMFERGVPLDIDTMLGRDETSGKTRLSVVYLNTLHSQEEKDFFLCHIVERLYHWMLKHPPRPDLPGGVQAVFYVDEIAKFIPPVRKPACKDALMMLFRQARKYGVGCVIATQSPGDIDYTALDQFGTWNLGQLKARQIKAKIINFLNAVDPVNAETVVNRLPALQKGQFVMLSPDEFDVPVDYKVRWLVTRHGSPLSDDDVAKRITPQMRARFMAAGAVARPGADAPSPPVPDEEAESHAAAVEQVLAASGSPLAVEEIAEQVGLDETKMQYVLDLMLGRGRVHVTTLFGLPGQALAAPPLEGEPELRAASMEAAKGQTRPAEPEPSPDADRAIELLRAERRCMTTLELSKALDASTTRVLRIMNDLSGNGLVKKGKVGASNVYWAAEYELQPQDGLADPVQVANLQVPERGARTKAEESLAGFFGKSERIVATEFLHLPLWQVDVNVQQTKGLVFKTTTEQAATLYLHAADGRVCTYHPSKGFAFSEVVDEDPLRIHDLDDVCTFQERMPGQLSIDKAAFKRLLEPDDVMKLVERKYIAKARSARLVLLPYWRFRIESNDGSKTRDLLLDGVVGKPLQL